MVEDNRKQSIKLIEQLDKLLSKVGENFGPIILKELEIRIDKTINNFNEEVSTLLGDSFINSKNNYEEYKAYKEEKNIVHKDSSKEDINVPNYIKEHDMKKNRK